MLYRHMMEQNRLLDNPLTIKSFMSILSWFIVDCECCTWHMSHYKISAMHNRHHTGEIYCFNFLRQAHSERVFWVLTWSSAHITSNILLFIINVIWSQTSPKNLNKILLQSFIVREEFLFWSLKYSGCSLHLIFQINYDLMSEMRMFGQRDSRLE